MPPAIYYLSLSCYDDHRDLHSFPTRRSSDLQIAPVVVARLLEEGIELRGLCPRRVTRQDVAQASRVVSFGCDLGDLAVAGVEVERWDDVPAVSDDFDRARAAIRARVARLSVFVLPPPRTSR